jgi:hypothetical protein
MIKIAMTGISSTMPKIKAAIFAGADIGRRGPNWIWLGTIEYKSYWALGVVIIDDAGMHS